MSSDRVKCCLMALLNYYQQILYDTFAELSNVHCMENIQQYEFGEIQVWLLAYTFLVLGSGKFFLVKLFKEIILVYFYHFLYVPCYLDVNIPRIFKRRLCVCIVFISSLATRILFDE